MRGKRTVLISRTIFLMSTRRVVCTTPIKAVVAKCVVGRVPVSIVMALAPMNSMGAQGMAPSPCPRIPIVSSRHRATDLLNEVAVLTQAIVFRFVPGPFALRVIKEPLVKKIWSWEPSRYLIAL